DHETKQDDCRTNNENRNRVSQTPKDTNQSSSADASLPAHNRRYRDDVIRIGRVAHAEKKAKSNDGNESDHLFSDLGGARTHAPAFERCAATTAWPRLIPPSPAGT